MDLSEVSEYNRTSDANQTLAEPPSSQPKRESEFADNSNNITHTQCLPSSSNLGMFF